MVVPGSPPTPLNVCKIFEDKGLGLDFSLAYVALPVRFGAGWCDERPLLEAELVKCGGG
jgi:hypothetical protein